MKKSVFTLFLSLAVIVLFGQMIYTEPAIPTADAAVTVYFDAEGTALEGYSGELYAHTGVTVNGAQWQNVIGTWGVNNTQPQFVNLEVDLYKLEMTPTIRDFYGVSSTGVISEMCMVIRNAEGSAQTTPDIFIEVYELGLNVNLISPSVSPFFVDPGESIDIEAEATLSVTLSLYIDDVLIVETNEDFISETIVAELDTDTKHWIKVIASDGVNEVADSIYYYIRGASFVEALPAGIRDGINYVDDNTVTLVLNAPYKTSVYAIGDFNDWQVGPEFKLKRTTEDLNLIETRYWVTLENLTAGEEYAFQYLIDEELRIADPYTDKILDKWNDAYITNSTYPDLKPYPLNKTLGLVSILQTAQDEYNWQVTSFDPPDPDKLVVYELLLRDFIQAHDFNTLIDTISYFKRLGITAIELMPVNEFEGNLSWGYNPSFYFAPDKYYGPKDDLKAFIDECHTNGIAVIMDMVLNHAYGQNVMVQMYWDTENNRPAANNPWFNPVCPHEPYCWGNDFNHESLSTQAFVDSVNHYWMSEYNVDGFRFDFTQGFTNSNSGWQYDADRIALVKRMSDEIWNDYPDAYVILEHWCENNEEKELANYGCLLWGNSNYNYSEASMGWLANSNFDWISYKQRGWNEPGVMGFMESHDEERVMAKNINYGNASGSYNTQDTTIGLQRQELTAAFFITIPGPKMIWQFGERGYDYHINYPGVIGEEDHRLDEKPPRWDYMNDSRRKVLFNIYSVLNKLKQEQEVFNTSDYTLSLNGAMKTIHLNHSSMNVTILGNFDVTSGNINPQFQHTGWWYNLFAGDSLLVENTSANIAFEAGEYRIYTDVRLPKPDIGLGIEEMATDENVFSVIYPNPTAGSVNILLDVKNTSEVIISIFNPTGQVVWSLPSERFSAGRHIVNWEGNYQNGRKATAGLYFCEITMNGKKNVQKLMVY